MINDALAAYLRSNLSINVYINQAPLDSDPCLVVSDNGDFRERHWDSGNVVTGLITQEYELTYWAGLRNGGARSAAQQIDSIITLLDNFSGPMVDTTSPNTTHRIAGIEATNSGGEFDPTTELFGHSAFISITYA